MAQGNRVILPGLPHYVAQRGRCVGGFVFREPTDYRVFLHLLEESCGRYEVAIWGYALLAGSYHLILVPENAGSLDAAMRRLDSEFAHYHNLRHMVRGPVWDSAYRSAAMCWSQVWDAIAFAEREPVRQEKLGAAWAHPWSSAPARLGRAAGAGWLDLEEWGRHWDASRWMKRLQAFEGEAEFGRELTDALRSGTTFGEMLAWREPVERIGPLRAGSFKDIRRTVAAAG